MHLAIGMFDGVHLGHAQVTSGAVDAARAIDGVSSVLTFPDHPSKLLRPEAPTPLIMDAETKAGHLLELGLDHVFLQAFDEPFSKIEADAFSSHLKTAFPTLESVHVGQDFRFGHGRSGDVALLTTSANLLGVEVTVSPPVEYQGDPISSSRIREALRQGDIGPANEMLGRSYEASGVVESGAGRGADLGFPTLNLPWNPGAKPRLGVYAVELVMEENNSRLPGVANYGVRPTFEENAEVPVLETHLFEDAKIKPGDLIRVALRSFLRDEHRFGSVDELRQQIARDKQAAREALL